MLTYFAYERNQSGAITRINHEANEWTYFTYDALDRLTEERRVKNPTIYGFTYQYDAASNRTQKTNLVSSAVTDYTINSRNLIASEVTSGVTTAYEYDQSQRMKTRYSPTLATYFTHDQRQQPTKIEFAVSAGFPDATREFKYTGTGERAVIVGELGAGYATQFSYDGSRLLTEKDEFDNTYGQYRWACPGGLLESKNIAEDGPAEGPAKDERGSVNKLSGVSGSAIYDSFGVEFVNNLASTTRTRFVSPTFVRLATGLQLNMTKSGLVIVDSGCALGHAALLAEELGIGETRLRRINKVLAADLEPWVQISRGDSPLCMETLARMAPCVCILMPEICSIEISYLSAAEVTDVVMRDKKRRGTDTAPGALAGAESYGKALAGENVSNASRYDDQLGDFYVSFASPPIMATLHPAWVRPNCRLAQNYSVQTNFPVQVAGDSQFENDKPDVSPISPDIQNMLGYEGWRFFDRPSDGASVRPGVVDQSGAFVATTWQYWWQARVYVWEAPRVKNESWGFAGAVKWDGPTRTASLTRGYEAWRHENRSFFIPPLGRIVRPDRPNPRRVR